jgi:ABC-type glycerol-3-phosphate transport system substrate-binding protein
MADKQSDRSLKMSRREMLRLTALTGLGLVAAGCVVPTPAAPEAEAPAATEAPAAEAPAGEKVQVRYVAMDYDENMKPDTQAVIDAFNASQDQVEATLDVVSWGQGHELLVTQISGGQPPDLANVSAQWQGEWEGIDEVMPLDDYLSEEFLSNFVPSMLAAFTNKDGQLMGMPYFLDPRIMYYRTDLFEAEGLAAPTTWDEVIAAGQALHNPPDMTGYGQTFSGKSDGLDYWWYAWFGAVGADGDLSIWTEDGHSKLNTPEAIQATQYVVDLTQKYQITNTDYTTAGRDEELQPLFYAGKLAQLITGSWFPTLIANNAPDMPYGLEMPPVAEAGMAPATGVWPDSVIMFKQTEHPEAAAQLLEFMFNAENRLAFAKQRGVIPERIDVGNDPAYAVSDTEKFMVASLDHAHNVYATPWPATYYQTIQVEAETLIGRAVAGEISAEEAMLQAAENIDKTNGL